MENKLLELIKKNNDLYYSTMDKIIKENLSEDNDSLNIIKKAELKVIHNYRDELQFCLINNIDKLSVNDFLALDLVPYKIYQKLNKKTRIIISEIEKRASI